MKNIDVFGSAHGGGSLLDKLFVQHGGRIDQHIAVIAADCTDQAIRAGSIGFAHGIEKVLLRKGDFEGIELLEADFLQKRLMLASEVFVFCAMVVIVLATTALALWMTYCAISFSLTVKLCCIATIFEMTGDTIINPLPRVNYTSINCFLYHTL